MGSWGYYDDETDPAQDVLVMIIQNFLCTNDPEYKKAMLKLQKISPSKEGVKFYLKELKPKEQKLRKNFDKKFMKYASKFIKDQGDNRHWLDVTGTAIVLARQGKRSFPTKLPKDFPEWLRKESCKIWNDQLQEDENFFLSWKTPKHRIKAINKMLNLCKCKKSRSSRPSPSESATMFPKGTKKKGNDGNIWIIVTTKMGTKRWKKHMN